MIRYYFGGKPGLYKEVCSGIVQLLRARIDAMGDGAVTVELGTLLGGCDAHVGRQSLVAGVDYSRSAVAGRAAALDVRARVPDRLVPMIEKLVRAGMERGQLRADLDPRAHRAVDDQPRVVPVPRSAGHEQGSRSAAGRRVPAAPHPTHFGRHGAWHSRARQGERIVIRAKIVCLLSICTACAPARPARGTDRTRRSWARWRRDRIEIVAEESEPILSLDVREGDQVTLGQVLMKQDTGVAIHPLRASGCARWKKRSIA